jgi:3-oxoacyl-[acyl-carrier-protein] synthase II
MDGLRDERRREAVVITGLGAVTPLGADLQSTFAQLSAGQAAIEPLCLFDGTRHRTGLAGGLPGGRVPSTPALEELLRSRGLPPGRLSRTDRMALLAALEAWTAAGLARGPQPRGVGLFFGTSTGGMFEGEASFARLQDRRGGRCAAASFAPQPTSAPADALCRAFGLDGPTETLATACAASTMALGSALDALRAGEVELALVGGADGLCQTTYGGFNALRAVDERPARPFRPDREGLSLGEGAAVLVLETAASARARGARPIVELAGAGATCDAYHMTAPSPEAEGAARAMELALADAGLGPECVDFVNAHGTGTPHNDAAEWAALQRVFGARARVLPVTANKGAIGHLLGACGALEAAVTALALARGLVPPTPGEGPVDPAAPVDLVLGAPRALPGAQVALSLNLAFGGANAAVVLRRVGERRP